MPGRYDQHRHMVTNRRLAAVLLAVFLAGVLPVTTWAHGRHFDDDGTIDTSHPDWMKWVPDATSLSQLSIPGTHDSLAFYGGDLAQTQTLDLTEQLNAGIRAIDIRCRHIEDVFAIHHGVIFQKTYFGNVLDDATAFLQAHPSETIVMRVKEEL